MPDIDTVLTEDAIAQLPEDFSVQIAALSDTAQTQVLDAVSAAHDSGTLSDLNIDHTLADAQLADDGRANVEAMHQQQADAVASGDYARADEIAHNTEYQLHEVQDHGGDADQQLVTSESDQAHLDWAQYHQDTAHEEAGWAADAANHGDAAHAADYADMAATHADTAAADAAPADQGGHYGDHGYDSSASTGAETADASVASE